VLFWIYAPITIDGKSLGSFVYEIVPGVILSTMAIIGVSLVSDEPSESMQKLFDTMVLKVDEES
jgi:SSS family solute:Na+ symporter